jgi:hypothetical protein
MTADDTIERAARRVAAAFGTGSAWAPRVSVKRKPEHGSAGSDDERPDTGGRLAVVRRGRTVERRCDFVPADALAALSDTDRAEVARWRLEPMQAPDPRRPDRVREHVAWTESRTHAATPSGRMQTDALTALSYAKLSGPLDAWFSVYALQRWDRWPTVARYAAACGLNPIATLDAAELILTDGASTPQDVRARQLRMRAADYRHERRVAEHTLRDWLLRAAERFLRALESDEEIGTASAPLEGYPYRASLPEAASEATMAPTKPDTGFTADDRQMLRRALELLEQHVTAERAARGRLTLVRTERPVASNLERVTVLPAIPHRLAS